jgi:hypothetical protein
MTKEQALQTIAKEKLNYYNMDAGQFYKEDEVIIRYQNGFWMVFVTDERASVVSGSERFFNNESDAWDNFIKRLRADKVLRGI